MDAVATLFDRAAELPEAERAELAGLLIGSLESERDPDVDAAWTAEIRKRLADFESGKIDAVPWERVREELFARLRGP